MADKIRYSISVTPVETVTQAVAFTNIEDNANHADVTNNSHDVIATEVATSLGGTGEAVCNGYNGTAANQGYLNQTVNYGEAGDSADTNDLSSETTASFIFIKNTGKTFSSATALGDTLNKALKVMYPGGTSLISVLDPGEAIVFKDDNLGLDARFHVRTVDLDGGDNSSAGHLAVEYLVVD